MTARMDRVKQALRTHDELCSLDAFYGDGLSNGRNDVATLINRDGWTIDRHWTSHGDGPAHVHYRRISEGLRQAKQLTLA